MDFVKRGILESADGGNTFAEVSKAKEEEVLDEERETLYEQLSRTLKEKRMSKIEGKPEEFALEDQEFVDQIMRQKEEQAKRSLQSDLHEFKRQKLIALISASNTHSANGNSIGAGAGKEGEKGDDNTQAKAEEEEEEVVITIKKKKKKPQTTGARV